MLPAARYDRDSHGLLTATIPAGVAPVISQ